MKPKNVSTKLPAELDPQERSDIAPGHIGEPNLSAMGTPRSVARFGMPRSDPDDFEDVPKINLKAFRELLQKQALATRSSSTKK